MQNYKIVIQYDGTRYDGWQKQGNTDNTIQGKIEAVLKRMAGEEVEIAGAGRTDAGAHALGQVANFKLKKSMSQEDLQAYLNQYLPEDIVVTSVKKVNDRFHSRLTATGKQYDYRILNSPIGNPFTRKYTWKLEEELDFRAMREAAALLTGTHDYASFCSNRKMKKSTIRTVDSIEVNRIGGEIVISFHGEGFLYNMVRIMAGTIVEVGQGKRRPEEMTQILEQKNREAAGITAPAQGLFLMKVEYEKNPAVQRNC